MRRKNKKTSKLPVEKESSTSPVEYESVAYLEKHANDESESNESNNSTKIKIEKFTKELNNEIDIDINSNNSQKTDLSSSDLNGQNNSESIDSLLSENPIFIKKEPDTSNNSCEIVSNDDSFLFVELKLISIDQKCSNYKKISQKFLCVNSNAVVDHLKKLIFKKMMIDENCFEIAFMCNGFEVKTGCPLIFLKNKFFLKQEKIIIYYAILEQHIDSPCYDVEPAVNLVEAK